MVMAGGSHHPTISVPRAATGSTMTATAGGAAPGSPSTAAREAAMERSGPLRCPRCDSSNTKFCYYNNYSLSQPRHFCKDCKRYWTRGGTLRNVPVGGRCRKNKCAKKHISSSSTSWSSSTATNSSSSAVTARTPSLPSDPKTTPIATTAATAASETGLGPLFYGPAPAASQHNFSNPCLPYYLQSLGLFPSNADEDCLPVIKSLLTDHRILRQMAPAASPTPSLSSLLQDSSLFGSNSLASLQASSLRQQQQQQQQQRMTQNPHLPPCTTLLSYGTASENPPLPNDVKVEANGEGITTRGNGAGQSRFGWQTPTSCESALLETVAADSLHYWNAAAASAFGAGGLLQ